jgi:hypothetical protein
VEFTNWARMNPGTSTPGAAFFSTRQGKTPFFDETTINQIRSDIKKYHSPVPRSNQMETEFSARLFLAVAQENDLATASLDQDLSQFKAMEKDFLESLKDADDAAFDRQSYGGTIWREDPGGKLTEQRIRAWAALAAADDRLPDLMITTSSAVIETLSEIHGVAIRFEKLTDIRLPIPPDGTAPVLSQVLVDLVNCENLPPADFSSLKVLAADAGSGPAANVTLFAAVNRTAATVVRKMAPAATVPPEENDTPASLRHTLFVLVES